MADGEPERPPNGVFVERVFKADGSAFGVNLALQGDLRVTELVSVLEVALAMARRQLDPERTVGR